MQNAPATQRHFLKGGASLAGAAICASADPLSAAEPSADAERPGEQLPPGMSQEQVDKILFDTPPTTRRGDMLYRKLGQTGEEVSLIGMGGFHIGSRRMSRRASG